jgi:hypothetical protein
MFTKLYAGDTKIFNLEVKRDNLPVDITGSVVTFTMKSNIDLPDEDAAVQVVVTSHVDAPSGQTQIVIPAEMTNDLLRGKYYYDIQFKDLNGNVQTLIYNTVEVLPTVTKTL